MIEAEERGHMERRSHGKQMAFVLRQAGYDTCLEEIIRKIGVYALMFRWLSGGKKPVRLAVKAIELPERANRGQSLVWHQRPQNGA